MSEPMMDAASFEVSANGRLIEVDSEEARRRWRAGDGVFWIDFSESSRGGLEPLLDEVGVKGLLKTRMLASGQGASFAVLRRAVFAEWPIFADEACNRRSQVAALCLPNLIVTFRSEPIELPADAVGSFDASELGPASNSTHLSSMLLWHGARTTRAARAHRQRLLMLDQRMDVDPGDVDASELADLKADLLLASGIIEEQDETFSLLSEARSEALDFGELQGPMSLLRSAAAVARRVDDRLDGRFRELRHRTIEYKQDMLNVRIGFLTVISTIFLPLTLLAGIWGMNFEVMPELKQPWAYPAALGAMALVAAGVAWSLHKRGWFD
ncbi:MAG: magnesium transporter CorA family protein [Polyangiales bacterium]